MVPAAAINGLVPDPPVVLVVDDEPQIRMALEDLLEDDFDVLSLATAEEALEVLAARDVSVLLTDQRMPGTTGDELLRQARSRTNATRVLITGYADMEALARAVNNGQIYAYVRKPWDPMEMRLLVHKAADHYRLVRSYEQQTRLLNQLLARTPDAIYFKDPEGRFIQANRPFARRLGVDEPAWLQGRSHLECRPEDERSHRDHAEDLAIMAEGKPLLERLQQIGEEWLSVTKLPLEETGLVAVLRDVTQHKRSEELILAQARQQRCLATLGRLALTGAELSRLFEEAVKGVKRHLQVDRCGIFQLRGDRLVMVAGTPEGQQLLETGPGSQPGYALETGRPVVTNEFSRETRFYSGPTPAASGLAAPIKGWGAFQVLSLAERVFEEQEVHFLVSVCNLLSLAVHKQQAEEELETSQQLLLQSQKLEAIGRMAGGIAHDFNNILTIVRGNAELLPPTEEVDEILEAVDKASNLVGQLLAFGRHQPVKQEVIDVNQAVARDEKLLRRLLTPAIKLVVKKAPEPAWTLIDPGRLTQILVNLVANARDAMTEGGTIFLRVSHETMDDSRWVKLEIQDTGAGMEPDVLARVFEPFFTTKGPGKGTGLGLATSYGIVNQAGGIIDVTSQLGQGTTFRIHLPATLDTGAPPVQPGPLPPAPKRAAETILVVDDESSILKIVSRCLEKAGYGVLTAGSAEEAAQAALTHAGAIDMLLTDLVLPGVGGLAIAAHFRKSFPEAPVLFMSGYSEELAQGTEPINLLPKPFSTSELLLAVRQSLHPQD